MDRDNDGSITVQDILNYMTSKGQYGRGLLFPSDIAIQARANITCAIGERMSEQEVKEMVKAADVSGDGKVNYEEFVKILVSAPETS